MTVRIDIVDSLDDLATAQWDALAGSDPFTGHTFLHLLQQSGCATQATGWMPNYLLLREGSVLRGAVAAYLKSHSRGEFVFDQGWAEAWERVGGRYYPKLVVAVPFTPVEGPRLLSGDAEYKRLLADALIDQARRERLSSIHVLFAHEPDLAILREAGFMIRTGVQFHWRNAGYASFEDFAASLTQDKRKKLRQDRRRVSDAGVTFRWIEGAALDDGILEFFYRCYQDTYDRHWGQPYLTLDFFRCLHAADPQRLLLILAERGGQPLACALNVKGDGVLYGRYWGTREFVPGLHFETCYAQAIDYCIRHGYRVFEGGAQGEHKMARGLLPVRTHSAHWIADDRLAAAVDDFLQRETQAVDAYVQALGNSAPFRSVSMRLDQRGL